MPKILTVFGTRPEIIKLAPVISACKQRPAAFTVVSVASSQHEQLLRRLIGVFDVQVDYDLRVMRPAQTPDGVCARVLDSLDPILKLERPDAVVVQGDTTTALAGALSAFYNRIPLAHVEAGLRSGDADNPFPEEMNRRLISQLATFHFAATERNRATLLREGVAADRVFVTGNPVVDAVTRIAARSVSDGPVDRLRRIVAGRRLVVLTTHRRESFGARMLENLRVLRRFVDAHKDVALVFPVHPNPNVVEASAEILSGHARIYLIEPLDYPDFIALLSRAWLIVSDSGGVQEEAPTLGKPLIVLRDNTERPEAIDAGIARLVGGDHRRFAAMLEDAARPGSWTAGVRRVPNPFGSGDSGQRIADTLARVLVTGSGSREPAVLAAQ